VNLQKFGGRRFLLTIMTGWLATWLQYSGKMDPAGANYMLVVIGTVGAYITGNVFENKHNVENAK
jgi:uncharacterized membrane protein YeaQ/YmgE (transglycosylase-associated protein family)